MLCVVGDLVEDIVARALAPTLPDTDNPAVVERVRGGSGANVAAAAAALGRPVRFVGCVGADELGDRLVADLAAGGVDVRVQRGSRTGTIVVIVAPDGGRTMYPDRGAAAELGPIDPAWADGVTWLHVPAYALGDEPAAAAIPRFAGLVRAAGGRLSVDVSSVGLVAALGPERFTGLVEELAPDVVLATAEEAAMLARSLLATTIVKDGARPVVVRHPDGRTDAVAVPSVDGVVDTTGAGDAFAAGFIVASIDGAAPAAAAAAGVRAAARTLHSAGGRLAPE
jgi:sugar/nucleoside kinase (ribokinase family)